MISDVIQVYQFFLGSFISISKYLLVRFVNCQVHGNKSSINIRRCPNKLIYTAVFSFRALPFRFSNFPQNHLCSTYIETLGRDLYQVRRRSGDLYIIWGGEEETTTS
jgi:hypothetical protein